jgi:hypothetical protein
MNMALSAGGMGIMNPGIWSAAGGAPVNMNTVNGKPTAQLGGYVPGAELDAALKKYRTTVGR